MTFYYDFGLTRLVDEPIPTHVVHCRSLTLELGETKKIKETKEKIISLIKLSDPVSLTLDLQRGHLFLAECLSTISEMENFTKLELSFNYSRRYPFHIDKRYAPKFKVLHVRHCELASIDRLTSLVELKLEGVIVSDKELNNIASLPRLKILGLQVVHKDRYGDFGCSLFSSGLEGLTELDLSGSDYIDQDIWRHLKRLGQLRKLNLEYTNITDADLGHISNLTELTELDISCNCHITDSGLQYIKNLTKLTMLNISDNSITDAGLQYIVYLTKLTKLNVSDTKITDAGIEYLIHLGNLKVLDLTFNSKINSWSESHQPKDHPITRLIAAGCFVYHRGI